MYQSTIRPAASLSKIGERLGASPYLAAVFLSAVLVFLVQPMFAKMATPLLGGSPNVWNVSLVCFQAALLLGYTYAHALSHFVKSLRAQIGIHAALLLVCSVVLPFQLTSALGDPSPSQPTLWLIGVFALSIAPPFAIISATAPLIQSWYSHSGRSDAHDPYHLYAASNVGSLLGLAAYPVILEPLLPLAAQTSTWSLGYGILAVCLLVSGLIAWTTGRDATTAPSAIATAESVLQSESTAVWRQRAWWITLAFIPSSLLVGVTTYIATDLASAPFLWAVPLMIYILSFILVFAKTPPISLDTSASRMPIFVAMALLTLPSITGIPLLLSIPIHLGTLFIAAMMCHGRLVAERPATSRLTEFYLLMSLGGVLGGAFNALLVPVIFTSVIEYPLIIVTALLVRTGVSGQLGKRERYCAIAAACVLVAALSIRFGINAEPQAQLFAGFLAVACACILLAAENRYVSTFAAIAAWWIGVVSHPLAGGMSERGFFGVVKVIERGNYQVMMHGTTLHGAQYLDGADRLRPTTYYAPEAAIGQVFAAHSAAGRIGVVGLGTGSVACYAKPGQNYTYYEIDPLVAKFASDPQYFSYLSECTPDPDIVLGDGRLTLAAEPAGAFELLLIDAFSSDAVPAHLLTHQAVDMYLSRLSEQGVLVMHVSNNHMDLEKIVGRIANHLNVPALHQFYSYTDTDPDHIYRASSSSVIVLAKSEAALARFEADDRWAELQSHPGRVWSDDYSNVVGAIWEKYRR